MADSTSSNDYRNTDAYRLITKGMSTSALAAKSSGGEELRASLIRRAKAKLVRDFTYTNSGLGSGERQRHDALQSFLDQQQNEDCITEKTAANRPPAADEVSDGDTESSARGRRTAADRSDDNPYGTSGRHDPAYTRRRQSPSNPSQVPNQPYNSLRDQPLPVRDSSPLASRSGDGSQPSFSSVARQHFGNNQQASRSYNPYRP